MILVEKNWMSHPVWRITSRLVLAVFAGYALTNLVIIALVGLVNPNGGGALLLGMTLSFLLYAAIVIWAYCVRDLTRAWVQMLVANLLFAVLVWGVIV